MGNIENGCCKPTEYDVYRLELMGDTNNGMVHKRKALTCNVPRPGVI